LVFFSACKLDSSAKKSRPLEQELSTASVTTTKFYDLRDSSKLCPYATVGAYEFIPEGLQFFCSLSEKDIRYTFSKRDTTIYLDPCFEFFLDPGADGLDYYEFQFNARPAVWDLKLKTAKGRINAPSNVEEWDLGNNWEIKIMGTLNDDSDEDRLWSIYGIIPWEYISEGPPVSGDLWAYNFMRVDYNENNEPIYWAAYPTGNEMIHYPELWPTIKF